MRTWAGPNVSEILEERELLILAKELDLRRQKEKK